MVERRWHEGQMVKWRGIDPYTIVQLVGKAGNIHISETGRWHGYWHRERPDGSIGLVHHGGPEGFATLSAVKRQHERVMLGYTGLTIQVSLEQAEGLPEEEKQQGPPILGQTFPQLIEQLGQLEIPGEQQTLNGWIKILQDTNRDLPQVTNHGRLTQIRENLETLKDGLDRSINPHKVAAAQALRSGLSGSRGQLLGGINEAQVQLLQRTQQTVAITLGTMQRYNELERLQINWNGIVDKLPTSVAYVVRTLQIPNHPEERLERVVNLNILHENLGLEGCLRQLKGEPYYSRAQQFIKNLSPVKRLWEERDHQGMIRVLTKEAEELEVWRRRIREEYEGVNFGKYALS